MTDDVVRQVEAAMGMEHVDRAEIVMERIFGTKWKEHPSWGVSQKTLNSLYRNIRLALDTEVKAGGPYKVGNTFARCRYCGQQGDYGGPCSIGGCPLGADR